MSEIVFDRTCELVAAQLAPYTQARTESPQSKMQPAVICGLYAPHEDPSQEKIALVCSWGALTHETFDIALRPPQATIHPNETIEDAFTRKIVGELELSAAALRRVYGLRTEEPPIIGGVAKHNTLKAFGILCGVVTTTPKLTAPDDKLLYAGWKTFVEAEAAFDTQAATPHLEQRAERHFEVLDHIQHLAQQLRSREQ